MALIRTIALCLTGLTLAACADNHTEGQLWGAGAGAVAGGGIGRAAAIASGYPLAATGVGVLAGSAIGYAIGDYVDPPAQRLWAAATVAAAEAARPGDAISWQSHGHQGSVTMQGEGWTDAGERPCRALHQEASRLDSDEPPFVRDVVACRQTDGTWEVITPLPPDPAEVGS